MEDSSTCKKHGAEVSKSHISVGQMGTYKAALKPLTVVIISYFLAEIAGKSLRFHPFTQHLPLSQNTEWTLAVCLLYILFSTVWGPQYMMNRNPIKMKTFTRIYNVVQIISNAYCFYILATKAWFTEYSWTCEPVAYSDIKNCKLIGRVVYIFYLLKLLDLMDTVLFVLNKKWENITLLHLVHHGSMPIGILFGVRFVPNGQLTFLGFVNSFIHVVLYTYYFIASFGPKAKPYLWWKKYLTMMQMIQFASIVIHTATIMSLGCIKEKGVGTIIVSYAVMFFLLFLDFYLSVYKSKKKTE